MQANKLPRVLTIDEAARHFPGLTPTAIRRLVKTGEIPSRKIGSKFLITPEAVESWLSSTTPNEPESKRGVIRPVEEVRS